MKTHESKTEGQEIDLLKNEQKKTRIIGIVLVCVGFIFYSLTLISPIFVILGAFSIVPGLVLAIRSFVNTKFAPIKHEKESHPHQHDAQQTPPPVNAPREQSHSNQFDSLMTSQMVALYLNKQAEDNAAEYRNQYISRLMSIGISKKDAEKLFDFESEIIKKHNKRYLLSPNFTRDWFFGLQQKFFQNYPKEKGDILKEHFLTMSELCKIIDEAEWHFWNSHERDLPDDVWGEIWQWRLKGAGGEFAIKYFDMIVEETGVKEESVGLLGGEQGKHLSKYKWL